MDNTLYDPKEIELEGHRDRIERLGYIFEKEKRKESYWNDHMFWVLNNFFLYFVFMPKNGDTYFGRYFRNDHRLQLDAYRELRRELPDAGIPSEEESSHSSLYFSQTRHQFITEIEHVAEEITGSLQKIREIVDRWRFNTSSNRTEENARECFKALIPIYIALRKKGYSRSDLTG